jgi:DNA-directed RNA polymerase subunit L
MKNCINCGEILTTRKQVKFCSNKCQIDFRYGDYIKSWKNGNESGNKGIVAKGISGHLKRYLMDKYNTKCSQCGWNKKHPITGNVPLEIDHIDGNSENNLENNLRLLCPNCHALTPFFKNLNKGKGRKWRTEKYIKN